MKSFRSSAPRPFAAPLAGAILAWALVCYAGAAPTASDSEALIQAKAAAQSWEKKGYMFRAEAWEREVGSDKGKAARVQLFKGQKYTICVAAPLGKGAKLESHLLNAEGNAVEKTNVGTEDGHAVTLTVEPAKTGVYLITIRQTGEATVPVAFVVGYQEE